jgi:hypothetical protein
MLKQKKFAAGYKRQQNRITKNSDSLSYDQMSRTKCGDMEEFLKLSKRGLLFLDVNSLNCSLEYLTRKPGLTNRQLA